MKDFLVGARKFVAAAAAAVAIFIANGLLVGEAANWANSIIAAVGAALVYFVPNGDVEARRTPEGETVAGEASPLPTNTPVTVSPAPQGADLSDEQGLGV